MRFLVDEKQAQKNQAAIELLDSWLGNGEDAAEHQKSWDFLKMAFDEDHLWQLYSRSNNHGDGDDKWRSIDYGDARLVHSTSNIKSTEF